MDGFFGGVQTIGVASTPVTLTSPAAFTPTPGGGPTQSQNAILRFTGALTANVTVTLPLPGFYIIENLTGTSGGIFNLIFRAVGSGEIISTAQPSCQHIYNDGTNVRFVNLPPVGSFLDLISQSSAVPAWITLCTKPPYLLCDGSAFNGTTYPYLVGMIGGTTLPDLRGRARFYLNGGTNRITTASSGINGDTVLSAGGDQNTMSHTHGVIGTTGSENANHTHALNGGAAFTVGSSSVGNGPSAPGAAGPAAVISPVTSIESAAHQHAMNFASQVFGSGGSQNMPPATISGITMIRAG